jgi:hypothetical protein
MTEQQQQTTPPAAAPPAQPPAGSAPPVPQAPTGGQKQPPWGKPENFDADKAWELIENLRKEKGGADTSALQQQLEQMQTTMQTQRDALATALGVKPEETSDAQKLAEQINGLQKAVLDAERRAVSAATNVPEAMLTAQDADGIRAQAQALVEFAQAAHYAALTSTPPPTPPAFQQNPGQGQGNAPLTPEAQAAAEYEKYYPSK